MKEESKIDRRQFVKSFGAFGGLFAVGGFAARAAADEGMHPDAATVQRIFEGRLRHERLSLAYQHIAIGLEKPFSILHISDTHLCASGPEESENKRKFAVHRNAVFGSRQEESLRDSLEWAAKNVDAVLHTGDLIDFQTQANYALVKKYFGATPNLFGCMGNHEFQRRLEGEPIRNTTEYNALSAAELRRVYPFDLELQSTVLNGVNFVAIEQVYGFVTESQVARFREEVKKGLPIILCMHAPLMTEHIWRASCKFWSGCDKKFRSGTVRAAAGDYKRQLEDKTTAAFLTDLRKEPLLKGVLAGHLHIAVQDRFSPTAMEYVVGPNFLFHGQEVIFT